MGKNYSKKISSQALFELGFGYKYQYLISMLLYYIANKNQSINRYKRILNYLINKHSLNLNANQFCIDVENILKDSNRIIYKKNTIFMLEGENKCFEDINIFSKFDNICRVDLIQVKGSMSSNSNSSLSSAIIKTLNNMHKSNNKHLNFRLTIIMNKILGSNYLLQSLTSKLNIIHKLVKNEFMPKRNIRKYEEIFYNAFLQEYIDNHLKGNYVSISNIIHGSYKKSINTNLSNKFTEIEQYIKTMMGIIEKTNVITNIDYRLVYYFLKKIYGNDRFTKMLWNFEMTSMDGELMPMSNLRNKLKSIGYTNSEINAISFSEVNRYSSKVKIGKML